MNNLEIIFNLDEEILQLELIAQTIEALSMAMSESRTVLGNEILAIPSTILSETANKLRTMYNQINLKKLSQETACVYVPVSASAKNLKEGA